MLIGEGTSLAGRMPGLLPDPGIYHPALRLRRNDPPCPLSSPPRVSGRTPSGPESGSLRQPGRPQFSPGPTLRPGRFGTGCCLGRRTLPRPESELSPRSAFTSTQADDLLAVPAVGAYCLSMAGNYNLAPRPAVVLVNEGRAILIQRQPAYPDLITRDLPLSP